MQITGERTIPAGRERVWRSLADSDLLGDSVAGTRPILVRQTIREPFSSLGWMMGPDGPDPQRALVRLADDGDGVRLSYEISLADPDPEEVPGEIQAGLRRRIEQALDGFTSQVTGPASRAAGTLSDAIAASPSHAAKPDNNAAGTGGDAAIAHILNPSVIGGVLFLGVLLVVLGLL